MKMHSYTAKQVSQRDFRKCGQCGRGIGLSGKTGLCGSCIGLNNQKVERDFLLACDYLDGVRMVKLASKYNLTPERVRELLHRQDRFQLNKGLDRMMGVDVSNKGN